jgi:pyruvate kinase
MMQIESNTRKTKIIITLGKASSSVEALIKLLQAGIDAVRITTRFLHVEDMEKVLYKLREAENIVGRHVCVILSLREGDIRIGHANAGSQLSLSIGDEIRIVTSKYAGKDPNTISCNNSAFPSMVNPGDKLLVEFGKAIFTVTEIEDRRYLRERSFSAIESHTGLERYKRTRPKVQKNQKIVHCRAENQCILDDDKPLNFLNASKVSGNSMNNELEDIRLLEWAGPMDIDIIIYKQVRDLEDLRDLLSFTTSSHVKRFVGIQTKETAENPEDYLNISEGCSIGRGGLAVETSHSAVCKLQKSLVHLCNKLGKPVFISTQVLESMAVNDKPTRSEVVDAYCAVMDGADALMLTGETAYGRYPELAVRSLHKICVEAEQHMNYKKQRKMYYDSLSTPLNAMTAICYFAAEAVEKVTASVIICLTKSGKTARVISRFRPSCMIVAITDSLRTLKFLRVIRGVYPILSDGSPSRDNERVAITLCLEHEIAKSGDTVIFVGNNKDSFIEGTTTRFRIITIS